MQRKGHHRRKLWEVLSVYLIAEDDQIRRKGRTRYLLRRRLFPFEALIRATAEMDH